MNRCPQKRDLCSKKNGAYYFKNRSVSSPTTNNFFFKNGVLIKVGNVLTRKPHNGRKFKPFPPKQMPFSEKENLSFRKMRAVSQILDSFDTLLDSQ